MIFPSSGLNNLITNREGNDDSIKPDLVFSVCSKECAEVWLTTSKNIIKFIPASHYMVVVPDDEVVFFRLITDKAIKVVAETSYIGNLKSVLLEKMPEGSRNRVGWYLQQFVKLAVLKEASPGERYVIWDADTVPLKSLRFFYKNGDVHFYTGSENNDSYFNLTKKILGYGKLASFSFIAQCFPIKGSWAKDFFSEIEIKHKKNYTEAIIDSIDFNVLSGFSEYELLGCYCYQNFLMQIKVQDGDWLRYGNGLIGSVRNLMRSPYQETMSRFDFVSFENWDVPFSLMAAQPKVFIDKFLDQESAIKPEMDQVLEQLLKDGNVRTIVQIGANDGIQNDPIRKYISSETNFEIILVEPIPHYVGKLRDLYQNRNDVKIIQAAAGTQNERRELFFIPFDVANEMNGDGPTNNWAHGQGSFDKNIVVHWIKMNSFRGINYINNIDHYINSISSIEVPVVRCDDLLPRSRVGLLIVIDVQGFELDVLKGINWGSPPDWFIVEDDIEINNFGLISFFSQKGYTWVAGTHDKLFSRI